MHMKLYTTLAFGAIGIIMGLAMFWPERAPIPAPEPPAPDPIELHFPLRRVSGPMFVTDLSYLRDDNFLGEIFYDKFGITECYMHKSVMPNMARLEQILIREGYKAILFDCFRPHEAQHYMWKRRPNPRFLANPHRHGSMHSRGLAIDIALLDMDGNRMDFANPKDAFTSVSSHDFVCPKGEEQGCRNRATLKRIMAEAGFRHIRHEWWHYQIDKDPVKYPLISVCGVIACEE
jgi:D-alanyl-D-alanine dipeptidase